LRGSFLDGSFTAVAAAGFLNPMVRLCSLANFKTQLSKGLPNFSTFASLKSETERAEVYRRNRKNLTNF
jgi:hypothetical protein